MIAEDLLPLTHPVSELRLLPGNPRRGDVDAVARSLERFGQRKPIVARRDGTVVAGNHTLQAARQLGWAHLAVVWVDDDEATAKAFALADNRTAELGGYDDEALAAMVAEVGAVDMALLGAAGYSEADLAALLGKVEDLPPVVGDPDDVPEPPADPVSVLGDVWQLGPHRVLCADSTDLAVVEAMLGGRRADCMWTDPPYGVNYNDFATPEAARKARRRTDGLRIENDATPTELPDLLAGAWAVATAALKQGAPVYVAHPDTYRSVFEQAMNDAGWLFRQNLVWVKDRLALGRSDYHYRHEPILYGFTDGGTGRLGRGGERWYGDDAQTTVFDVPKPSKSEQHPTMKPVELITRMLVNSCPRGGIVYEPFGGSGSTLIAAHQLGASARVVELDPRYVDVICRRFQQATGIKPERVLEDGTTEPHDFTGVN